jgi:hypothetical protein
LLNPPLTDFFFSSPSSSIFPSQITFPNWALNLESLTHLTRKICCKYHETWCEQIPQSRGGGDFGAAGGEASADDARALHASGSASIFSFDGDGSFGLQHATLINNIWQKECSHPAGRSLDDCLVIQRKSDSNATAVIGKLLHKRYYDSERHVWIAIDSIG